MLVACYMGRTYPSFHQSVIFQGLRILAQRSYRNNFKFSISIHYRNRLVWLTFGHAPLNSRIFLWECLVEQLCWLVNPSFYLLSVFYQSLISYRLHEFTGNQLTGLIAAPNLMFDSNNIDTGSSFNHKHWYIFKSMSILNNAFGISSLHVNNKHI